MVESLVVNMSSFWCGELDFQRPKFQEIDFQISQSLKSTTNLQRQIHQNLKVLSPRSFTKLVHNLQFSMFFFSWSKQIRHHLDHFDKVVQTQLLSEVKSALGIGIPPLQYVIAMLGVPPLTLIPPYMHMGITQTATYDIAGPWWQMMQWMMMAIHVPAMAFLIFFINMFGWHIGLQLRRKHFVSMPCSLCLVMWLQLFVLGSVWCTFAYFSFPKEPWRLIPATCALWAVVIGLYLYAYRHLAKNQRKTWRQSNWKGPTVPDVWFRVTAGLCPVFLVNNSGELFTLHFCFTCASMLPTFTVFSCFFLSICTYHSCMSFQMICASLSKWFRYDLYVFDFFFGFKKNGCFISAKLWFFSSDLFGHCFSFWANFLDALDKQKAYSMILQDTFSIIFIEPTFSKPENPDH